MIEEDAIRPAPHRFVPRVLDGLGVAELEAYIETLRGEIARAEAAIARRRQDRSAADAVFGRPPGAA